MLGHNLDETLTDEQLKQLIGGFLPKLVESLQLNNPKLAGEIKAENENNIASLMLNMLKTLNGGENKLTPRLLRDEPILTKLLGIAMQCKLACDKGSPLDELKKLFDPNDPKSKLLLEELTKKLKELDLLKNKLKDDPNNPDIKKKIALLKNDLSMLNLVEQAVQQETLDLLKNQSETLSNLALQPGNKKTAADDPYINLLGLISSSETGCIPVIIEVFQGNGLGITDVNPNHGDAPIDFQNREALKLNPQTADYYREISTNMNDLHTQLIDINISHIPPIPKAK